MGGMDYSLLRGNDEGFVNRVLYVVEASVYRVPWIHSRAFFKCVLG